MTIRLTPHVEFLEASEVPSKIQNLARDLKNVKIGMAYVKTKGFRLFAKSLNLTSSRSFSKAKLRMKFVVGMSEGQYITDCEPLRQLMRLRKELGRESARLQIRYINNARFHPKMFLLTGRKNGGLLVGSSNITQGGLGNNKEANLFLAAERSYNAIQNADSFFNSLWKDADKLTEQKLKTYEKDKDKYEKTSSKRAKGKLPVSELPSQPTPKKEEMLLLVDGDEYPLNRVRSYCTECGRPIPIATRWLNYFVCSNHPGNPHILTRKRKAKINIKYSGHQIKDVNNIEGTCCKKLRGGLVCGQHFSLEPDFSHQICRRCYEERKKEKRPCSKIPPRAKAIESFFYDVQKDKIFSDHK